MMKKLLFLLFAVVGTAFSLNAQNLILNPSFETTPGASGNSFANWSATNGGAQMTVETTNIHSGVNSLKAISTGANEYNVQLQSDAVTTVVGTSYEVTFWIKSVGGASTMRLSTTPSSIYQNAQTIGTAWQQVTWAFVANTTATKISFDLGKSTDTFYIDDVEMYPLTKDNIINGGYETTPGASGNVFANWSATNGGAQMTQELTNFRTGASALKAISTGANEYNVQLQSDAIPTIIGRYYEMAIWIKSVGGASTMRLSTVSSGGAAYGASTVIGTSWQRLTMVFKANSISTKMSLDLGKSTETFYIDDAVFNSAQTTALGVANFHSQNNKMVCYPNPVIDNLNIVSDAEIKSIAVSDLNGKIVKTIKSNLIETVNLSDLNQGMYILTTDTNKQFKFLKK